MPKQGKKCEFAKCASRSKKDPQKKFIPFAKPWMDKEKCLRWLEATGRTDLSIVDIKYKGIYICEDHFVDGQPTEAHPDPMPHNVRIIPQSTVSVDQECMRVETGAQVSGAGTSENREEYGDSSNNDVLMPGCSSASSPSASRGNAQSQSMAQRTTPPHSPAVLVASSLKKKALQALRGARGKAAPYSPRQRTAKGSNSAEKAELISPGTSSHQDVGENAETEAQLRATQSVFDVAGVSKRNLFGDDNDGTDFIDDLLGVELLSEDASERVSQGLPERPVEEQPEPMAEEAVECIRGSASSGKTVDQQKSGGVSAVPVGTKTVGGQTSRPLEKAVDLNDRALRGDEQEDVRADPIGGAGTSGNGGAHARGDDGAEATGGARQGEGTGNTGGTGDPDASNRSWRSRPTAPYLSYENVTDKDFEYLCGLSRPHFDFLYGYLGGDKVASGLKYETAYGTPRQIRYSRLSYKTRLFITLCRLRRGFSERELAFFCDCSVSLISRIWKTWVNFLYVEFEPLRNHMFQDRRSQKQDKPKRFQSFNNLRVIVDCFEIKTETPSDFQQQGNTYSSYKSANTVKFIVGINVHGAVIFISEAFEGSMSDREVFVKSGIMDLLEPGDVVMADRGFDIKSELDRIKVKLLIPAYLKGRDYLSGQEEIWTKKIARARVFVENAIGRIKFWRISQIPLPQTQMYLVSQMFYVIACLSNFQTPLL